MRRKLTLVLVVMTVLLSTVPALAQEPFESFTLGREFAYYAFSCAGGEEIDFWINFEPADPIARAGVTAKVYAPPQGDVIAIADESAGQLRINFDCERAGPHVLEIANYHQNIPIRFDVVAGENVDNLANAEDVLEQLMGMAPEALDPDADYGEFVGLITEDEEVMTRAREMAARAGEMVTGAQALLRGSAARETFAVTSGFDYYTFECEDEGEDFTVELRHIPGDPMVSQGVTLKLYSGEGQLIERTVPAAGGAGITATCDPDERYVAEIANYHRNLGLAFELWVEGAGVTDVGQLAREPDRRLSELTEEDWQVWSGRVPPATTAPILDRAPQPTGAVPAMEEDMGMGVLREGTSFTIGRGFRYYTFGCPGDGEPVDIYVNFEPGDLMAEAGVTGKVYAPDGTVIAVADVRGGQMEIEYDCERGGTYVLEIANYHENISIRFDVVFAGETMNVNGPFEENPM
jgi:hypothetical protein